MPTEKSSQIDDTLTFMSGISRQAAAKKGICTVCKGPATEFRDALSVREHEISGLCQKCQDATFGGDE